MMFCISYKDFISSSCGFSKLIIVLPIVLGLCSSKAVHREHSQQFPIYFKLLRTM